MNWLDEIKWDADGLVPVDCAGLQNWQSADVRMDEPRSFAVNQ